MGILLYDVPASPPARAVRLTLKALELNYNLHNVNYAEQEHLQEEYLKMNPQHTIPTLKDGDFAIWDSHAINAYLVNAYGKDDSLYPKDPKKRAVVDQRMYFECGVLFPSLRRIVLSIKTEHRKDISPEEQAYVIEAYGFLEKFLEKGTKYIADDHITLPDFSIVPTLTTLEVFFKKINKEDYPLLASYLETCKTTMLGYEEINETGLTEFTELIKQFGFPLS